MKVDGNISLLLQSLHWESKQTVLAGLRSGMSKSPGAGGKKNPTAVFQFSLSESKNIRKQIWYTYDKEMVETSSQGKQFLLSLDAEITYPIYIPFCSVLKFTAGGRMFSVCLCTST